VNQKIKHIIKLADAKCSETHGIFDEILVQKTVEECCRIFNIWTDYDNSGEEIPNDDYSDVFQVKKVKQAFGIEK